MKQSDVAEIRCVLWLLLYQATTGVVSACAAGLATLSAIESLVCAVRDCLRAWAAR